MKTSEIARTLLASPRSVLPPRVLQEKLGTAGYSEALRLGWISPEQEMGAVQISSRRNHRDAMAEAAKQDAPIPVAPTGNTGLPARGFFGENTSVVNLAMVEPKDTPSPAAPSAAPGQDTKPAAIGDQVSVAEGGQTYSARVQSTAPDGSLKLSFSGSKPARDTYKPNEVRVTGRVPLGGAPGQPAPSAAPSV